MPRKGVKTPLSPVVPTKIIAVGNNLPGPRVEMLAVNSPSETAFDLV